MASTNIANRLGAVATNTDATSYVLLTSVTPNASGARVYVFVVSAFSTDPVQPTLSGTNAFSGAWTNRGSVGVGSNRRLTMFSGTTQSTTAGNLTADFGAQTELGCVAVVWEMSAVGNEAPVQVVTNSGTAVTSLAIALAAFVDVWNGMIGAFFVASATGQEVVLSMTEGMLTERVGSMTVADVGTLRVVFSPRNHLGPDVTFASNNALGIAAELDHDGSDVTAGGGVIGRGLNRAAAY